MMKKFRRLQGFSLLEMSIVLAIIAVFLGASIVIFSASLQKKQLEETQRKMQVIQKTLLDYRRAFNRLPCPADVTQPVLPLSSSDANYNSGNSAFNTSQYFGVEASIPLVGGNTITSGIPSVTCVGGGTPVTSFTSSGVVSANFYYPSSVSTGTATATGTMYNASSVIYLNNISGQIFIGSTVTGTNIPASGFGSETTVTAVNLQPNSLSATLPSILLSKNVTGSGSGISLSFSYSYYYVEGMVPTKTLRLPDEYAFDGWGNRIMYAIDSRYANIDSFNTIPITDTTTGITIYNTRPSNGGTAKPGLAAYVLLSFGADVCCGAYSHAGTSIGNNGNSDDPDETTNASNMSGGAFFVQHMPTSSSSDVLRIFDDVVVYATRADLRGAGE